VNGTVEAGGGVRRLGPVNTEEEIARKVIKPDFSLPVVRRNGDLFAIERNRRIDEICSVQGEGEEDGIGVGQVGVEPGRQNVVSIPRLSEPCQVQPVVAWTRMSDSTPRPHVTTARWSVRITLKDDVRGHLVTAVAWEQGSQHVHRVTDTGTRHRTEIQARRVGTTNTHTTHTHIREQGRIRLVKLRCRPPAAYGL
jgi:hypothetical protein